MLGCWLLSYGYRGYLLGLYSYQQLITTTVTISCYGYLSLAISTYTCVKHAAKYRTLLVM